MKQIVINKPLNLREINRRISNYIDEGLTFETIKTNYTLTVKFPNEKIKHFACVEKTDFKTMGLMNKAKAEILRSPVLSKLPDADLKTTPLFRFAPSLYDMKLRAGEISVIENITEIDLAEAYNKAFLNCQLVSPELYLLISAQHKADRLKILGSIATNKIVTTFENGKQIGEPEIINNAALRNAWFHVCNLVNECMMDAYDFTGSKALFYYVDGIYFHSCPKAENEILSIMQRHNFDFKIKHFKKIALANTGTSMKILIPSGKTDEPKNKVFTIPFQKVKKYYIKN